MVSARASWEVAERKEAIPSFFYERFGLSDQIAHLLIARGVESEEQTEQFLYPTRTQMHSPFLFTDMMRVVERIKMAVFNQEKVCVYGDYDADGVSSTALMYLLCKKMGLNVTYYIPHRANEGYGLHEHALFELHQTGTQLIITVDTGISAYSQIAYANQLGLEVIVTDHHEPPAMLPDAYAIINPKLLDCPYPFKGLAGVGVALKVAQACLADLPDWALQLATIGTLADVMPLTDENRVIVKLGLQAMCENPICSLNLFIRDRLQKSVIRAEDISFQLAPRINASGRLDVASHAVEYLIAEHENMAERQLQQLEQLNMERRLLVQEHVAEAVKMVNDSHASIDRVIVLAQPHWNPGVIGIVAAKILELYARSTIVFAIDEQTGKAKGSARAYGEFDMITALRAMDDLFEHYGGHQGAAGMTIAIEKIDAFRQQINEYATQNEGYNDHFEPLRIDAALTLHEIRSSFLAQLQLLEPFGPDNPQPMFAFNNVRCVRSETLGKQKEHYKLVVSDQQVQEPPVEIIAFQQAELVHQIAPGSRMELVVTCTLNEFRGQQKPQIILKDWRVQGSQCFDWRATSHTPAITHKIKQLLNCVNSEQMLFVVANHLDSKVLCDRLKVSSLPILVCDKNYNFEYVRAQLKDVRECQELIVYTWPHQPAHWLTQFLNEFNRLNVRLIGIPSADPARLRLPTFADFRNVYQWIVQQKQTLFVSDEAWHNCSLICSITESQLRFILDVFMELGILEQKQNEMVLGNVTQKQSISASRLVQAEEQNGQQLQWLQNSTTSELLSWFEKIEDETIKNKVGMTI